MMMNRISKFLLIMVIVIMLYMPSVLAARYRRYPPYANVYTNHPNGKYYSDPWKTYYVYASKSTGLILLLASAHPPSTPPQLVYSKAGFNINPPPGNSPQVFADDNTYLYVYSCVRLYGKLKHTGSEASADFTAITIVYEYDVTSGTWKVFKRRKVRWNTLLDGNPIVVNKYNLFIGTTFWGSGYGWYSVGFKVVGSAAADPGSSAYVDFYSGSYYAKCKFLGIDAN